MHELIVFSSKYKNNLSAMTIRQGLPVLFNRLLPTLHPRNTSSQRQCIFISPDGKKMLIANNRNGGQNNLKFWAFTELKNPELSQPLALFDGLIYTSAAGNTYYVIAGTNPFLRLYKWENHQVIAIDTQGLDNVYGVVFSDDESKLFVLHDKRPYLRVYDLNDFGYQDTTQNISVNTNYAAIYYFQNHLLFFGGTSSYNSHFLMFDHALNKKFSYNDSRLANNYIAYSGSPFILPYQDDKLLFIKNSSGNNIEIHELKINPPTLTKLHTLSNIPRVLSVTMTDEHLYLCHTEKDNKTISIYHLGDFSFDEKTTKAFDFMQSDIVDFAVIKKDTGKITGQVRDVHNTPASRTVRAYKRDTGELIAQTKSGADGNYQLDLPDNHAVDVQFMIQDGENLPDLFYARVVPETVP